MPEECVPELRVKERHTHTLVASESAPDIGRILNIEDCGSLCHLLRITARVLRAMKIFKRSMPAGDPKILKAL